MDEVLWRFNLAVKRIRGKDEFEMYKNYINDLPVERIAICIYAIFRRLKEKNNFKALQARNQGNLAYKFKDYQESLRLYTKSLRYATYNGEKYALALANRSAVYFDLEDYKSCIDDVNLCLQSNYPPHMVPKVYIRKAKCFQKLGEPTDMRKVLIDVLNLLDDSQALSKSNAEKYRKAVKELITASADKKPDPEEKFDVLPTLKLNPTFLGASDSITLKYNKRKGHRVVAKKDIVVGDILFVEKAYAFAPNFVRDPICNKKYRPTICQYCLSTTTSCVPCKTCCKYLYCNEKCRDSAWKEFHQWECIGVQADFFTISRCAHLALRIIFKAVLNDISTHTINFEDKATGYGSQDNNYPYIYNLPTNLEKMDKKELMECAAAAALTVNYLKVKTNFFEWMKQLPTNTNKGYKELMHKVGGLIMRHYAQIHRHNIPLKMFDNDCKFKMVSMANAICTSVATMNHSCIPNTSYYFVADAVVIKAVKNIKIDEEIYYSYAGFPLLGLEKEERQWLLKELHLLNCNCRICTDPRTEVSDSYLCIKCKGPAPLLDAGNQFTLQQCACLECNYKFTLPMEIAVRERLAVEFLFRFHLFENIDDANRCLEISKSIFRPNHSVFANLYEGLINYYRDRGNALCFIQIGNILADYLGKKFCDFHTALGLLYYMYCITLTDILQETAVKMNIEDLKEAIKNLADFMEKARVIFDLQYPPLIGRLQKVKKSISELRILHTLRIANEVMNINSCT